MQSQEIQIMLSSQLSERLNKICRQKGIGMLDLIPLIISYGLDYEEVLFQIDTHIKKQESELVERLQDLGYIE
ncbi:hypothetical protein [Anoxybacillus flavithermus]|uniref:hypothetical protein n=1 Tax=Anoxybacillus flavithermus TaxID=33934 RepID=UPI000556765F|nr:hypothetical protein [Anoxybacillus flavithermus]